MMISQTISQFSPDCSKLCMCSANGLMSIWTGGVAGGGTLLHQFSPSSHLAAPATCLAWASSRASQSKKKKKAKSEEIPSDLVAMGTSAGSVLVYSTIQANLVTTFQTDTAVKILSLCWSSEANEIFAGAEVNLDNNYLEAIALIHLGRFSVSV